MTIKELSDKLHVSKQTIRNYLQTLPPNLTEKIKKTEENGTIQLDDEIVIYITNKLKNKGKKNNRQLTENDTTDQTSQLLIETLQKELLEKNRQIEQLQKLLDQEQQLHLIAENKLLSIEQKEENAPKKKWLFW